MRAPIAKFGLPLAAACTLLGGCDMFGEQPETEIEGGNASGEVLDGTISDAMLPVDRLRSAAPQAPIEPGPGTQAPAGAEASGTPADATAPDESATEGGADEQPAAAVSEDEG